MKRFYIDSNGYPRWNDTGILVHRSVAKNLLGEPIPKGMIVHHIDGNKMNFRKNNIAIMTRAAHFKLHLREGMKFNFKKPVVVS
ncbi:MAG: HNH endonuclease signature motif containing protein [Candidatus Paceibacteria bacterium]